MATIVIVHGGFHGGWRWQEVRLLLQAAGQEVYTPTLTGFGERVHLATPEVGLDTHIQDVVNVLEYEDLRDVVLVGHSYGGPVLSGVADRAAARLTRLIYLDAVLLDDGECPNDIFSPEEVAQNAERARRYGEGWRSPPAYPPTEPPDRRDPRNAPMLLKACQQPLRLTGTGSRTVPAAYVHCTAKPGPDLLAPSAARARERGWPVYDLATRHSPLHTEAERTAVVDLLLTLV